MVIGWRTGFKVFAAGLMVGVLASWPIAVLATHSIPSPPWFWDINNNGVAGIDDSNRAYERVSSGWTTAKINRVTAAANEWASKTDWNPSIGNSPGLVATIRVDGAMPGYGACGYDWGGLIAGNCLRFTPRTTYYDIYESHVGINTAYVFYYGTGTPGAGQFDFWGIVTHELGHGVLLVDLYGSACGAPTIHTMCGEASTFGNGMVLRDLTSDDDAAATAVYAP